MRHQQRVYFYHIKSDVPKITSLHQTKGERGKRAKENSFACLFLVVVALAKNLLCFVINLDFYCVFCFTSTVTIWSNSSSY